MQAVSVLYRCQHHRGISGQFAKICNIGQRNGAKQESPAGGGGEGGKARGLRSETELSAKRTTREAKRGGKEAKRGGKKDGFDKKSKLKKITTTKR